MTMCIEFEREFAWKVHTSDVKFGNNQNGISIYFSASEFSDVWFNQASLKIIFFTWHGKILIFW